MANRAYLFPTDRADHWDWEIPEELSEGVGYYDSRETIPLAWWFLFLPDNLRLVAVEQWNEIRVQSEKQSAIELFRKRRPILDSIVGDRIDVRLVDFFLAVIEEWRGTYLVMDPGEVLGDMFDDTYFLEFKRILQSLSSETPSVDVFLERSQEYSPFDCPRAKAEVSILGYTYGQTGERLWREIVGDTG